MLDIEKYWRNWSKVKESRRFSCQDNCLIYLLTCKCEGKQYLGKTTDEFGFKQNNSKSNNRKNARNAACMQKQLMCKTDDKDPKNIKNYWTTLKTYVPRRVTRWGSAGRSPLPFFENWKKSALLLGKMPWLWSTMGKVSHLKWNF